MLGTMTMAAAAMQEMSSIAPKMVEGNGGVQVSEQNMAFHQSHKAEVHKFMQKVGKERLRQGGGKLPDCAK